MNDIERRALLGAAGAGALAAIASGRARGPLDPPAGPIASTIKPLSEVEPRTVINDTNTPGTATGRYRITRPGSYYLIDNVGGVNGKHAIEVAASDVTIDLNGFQLAGIAASGAFDGVTAASGGLSNITVMNGTCRNWGRSGVNLSSNDPTHCVVRNVRAGNCSGTGIVAGRSSIISGCCATGNNQLGIIAGFNGVVTDSTASENGGGGIVVNGVGNVSGCTASNNGGTGIFASGTVTGCCANANAGSGINVGSQGVATGCAAIANASDGVFGNVGATIVACTAADNGHDGFSVNDGGSILDCTAQGNATANFRNADGCLVRGCSAFSNNVMPSQTNFLSFGGESRLEHNNATGATSIGFDINGGGNFLCGNTARNNATNYSVSNGNVCLVVAAVTSGAINGNSGGVSPGSTNPWANYSF